jgi:(1->4)-alpha-D-glucan 1-alpha-D-glucosylmutase
MSTQPAQTGSTFLAGRVLAGIERARPIRIPETNSIPVATFRLQFRPGFGFTEARALAPFLHSLGITEVYASPIFKAREGSSHGYDVVDPLQLNPQLGTEREFEEFTADLKRLGIGLILDIVPNHMAANWQNPWWSDVLEAGRSSPYASYFDIDWDCRTPGCEGKISLPMLGRPYGEALENKELQLGLDEQGLFVRYYEHRLPLCLKSYRSVLAHRFEAWQCSLGAGHESVEGLGGLLDSLDWTEGRGTWRATVKSKLWALYTTYPEARAFLEDNIESFNGMRGDCQSFEWLDRLLREQFYRLVHWRRAGEVINYRRFFDINELIALRVEDEEVFGATHGLILRLASEGKVSGFRVDHVDGLRDPWAYLRRLADCVAASDGRRRGGKFYIVAEKILSGQETLPEAWPVAGTTGYDFLNAVNGVFVDADNLARIGKIYADFTGIASTFDELVYRKKKRVVEQLFPIELRKLATQLQVLAAHDRHACDRPGSEFAAALLEVTACLPVYRTYIRSLEVLPQDRAAAAEAIEFAKLRKPSVCGPVLEFLGRVLSLDCPDWFPAGQRQEWLDFVLRWQQFTGPAMAKGMEDTACYIYNRLVSLNVVGGKSEPFTVEQFHRFNAMRAERWPFSLNATSTHDTKRSEDVRARINVLSEVPDLWEACLKRWSEWNRAEKTDVHGSPAPDANEETLIYQVLLGAWPLCTEETPEFEGRMKAFVIKAAREAKVHTNWLSPDEEYERALTGFVERILLSGRFMRDFLEVQAYLAPFGAIGSLAQMLLKIASPGVPDFYQGTLLWDFSLVDPDNRRPVDFTRRTEALQEMKALEGDEPVPLVETLTDTWRDGRIKLYIAAKALAFRRRHKSVFLRGDYLPLEASGRARDRVVAFARRKAGEWVVAVAPRLMTGLCGKRDPFAAGEVWGDATIELPEDAPARWTNVFTGEVFDRLELSEVLGRLPVALLAGSVEADEL